MVNNFINFNAEIEPFTVPKHVAVDLQIPIQLGVFVLSAKKRRGDCTVNIKNKNGNASCKLEGDRNAVASKMLFFAKTARKRRQAGLIQNICLTFAVPSKIHKLLLSDKCAGVIQSKLKMGFHVFKTDENDVINVSMRGPMERLIQVYAGIQHSIDHYGGPNKVNFDDLLFKTTHVGEVPTTAIPSPLLHQHKNMQTASGARIAYGVEIVKGQFKKVTVIGPIWSVEEATRLISEAVEQKKSVKKSGLTHNQIHNRKAVPLNPQIDNDQNATLYVQANIVGHVIGKQRRNLSQMETIFNVTATTENIQMDGEEMTKITVKPRSNRQESGVYQAVWWICSFVRKINKLQHKSTGKKAIKEQPKETTFECGVCFDTFGIRDGIACVDFERKNEEGQIHSLCNDCTQGLATEASNPVSEKPLACGGVGIPCTDPECPNVLPLSGLTVSTLCTIRWLLDEKLLKQIEKRCMDECIREAGITNLVTCFGCDNMIIVDGGFDFHCPECNRHQCRECLREYDEKHFAKTCKQVDEEEERERLEAVARGEMKIIHEQMSESMIRKCPGCATPMTKLVGCNKIICSRCQMRFCYVCLQKNIDYSHFGRGCELFTEFNDMNEDVLKPFEEQLSKIRLVT